MGNQLGARAPFAGGTSDLSGGSATGSKLARRKQINPTPHPGKGHARRAVIAHVAEDHCLDTLNRLNASLTKPPTQQTSQERRAQAPPRGGATLTSPTEQAMHALLCGSRARTGSSMEGNSTRKLRQRGNGLRPGQLRKRIHPIEEQALSGPSELSTRRSWEIGGFRKGPGQFFLQRGRAGVAGARLPPSIRRWPRDRVT